MNPEFYLNQMQNIDSQAVLNAVLKNVNAYVLLINSKVEVLFTNYFEFNDEQNTIGQEIVRVGDLLHCHNAERAEGGCGTHELCSRCQIRKAIETSFEKKKSFPNIEDELEIVLSDGTITTCDVNISGKYLSTADDGQVVLTIHDITLLKKTQRELADAKHKAEKANQFKSEFLSNMGHEIRNPLNAIVGFSELLIEEMDPESRKQYIEIIRMNNGLLQQLVADILDLSKIEAGKLEFMDTPIDVNQFMTELEHIVKFKLVDKSTEVSLIRNCPEDSLQIMIDQNRLMQVLINFITNAIKFTEEGSIEIGYERRDNELYFYVKDTGEGIPADKLNTVFDRFISLSKKNVGTGLGLAISKTIIEKFDGEIGADSVLGEGSTFWFTLPLNNRLLILSA